MLGSGAGVVLWKMRSLTSPYLSQDDLREQALKLEQRLTDTEAEKSQVCTELQDLQRQLSQNQEGEKLKAGREVWREDRGDAEVQKGQLLFTARSQL